ncbi:hypothetical protein ANANG_G00315170, partial [Anguilla anguilla]
MYSLTVLACVACVSSLLHMEVIMACFLASLAVLKQPALLHTVCVRACVCACVSETGGDVTADRGGLGGLYCLEQQERFLGASPTNCTVFSFSLSSCSFRILRNHTAKRTEIRLFYTRLKIKYYDFTKAMNWLNMERGPFLVFVVQSGLWSVTNRKRAVLLSLPTMHSSVPLICGPTHKPLLSRLLGTYIARLLGTCIARLLGTYIARL